MLSTKLIHIVTSLSVLFAFLTDEATAKSVYVVSDTGDYMGSDSYLRAYEIAGSSLIYQNIQYKIFYKNAVGISIDESDYGAFLFVTFEGSGEIEIVNAKTMRYVDTVTNFHANNLAGIVVDKGRFFFDSSRRFDIIEGGADKQKDYFKEVNHA